MRENYGERMIGREYETREIKRRSEVLTAGEREGDEAEVQKMKSERRGRKGECVRGCSKKEDEMAREIERESKDECWREVGRS